MTIQIKHYCRILPGKATLNGKTVLKSAQKNVEMLDFLSELYHKLGIDYRKFFKMDALSKAGFLASEMLLKESDREQVKEDTGIVLFNENSSMENDMEYQQTIQDQDNYFPSPAVFVYTLPNIVAGEIAIRNNIRGETAFYILPAFDAKKIEEIVTDTLNYSGMKQLLTGWVEVYDGHPDVCMMLCVTDEQIPITFNQHALKVIYQQ
jgi:hypothetical protein